MAEYRVINPRIFQTHEHYRFVDPRHLHADVLSILFRSRNRFLVENRGISLRKFLDEGVGFFVTRSDIDILKKPSEDMSFDITSYVQKYYLIGESSRIQVKYQMNSKKDLYFEGTIDFAIMDIEKQKAIACPKDYWNHFATDAENGCEPTFDELKKEFLQKPFPVNIEKAKKYKRKVLDSEIDLYQHVNTTHYIKYIFEQLEENNSYKSSTLLFKKSLLKNDNFVILLEEKDKNLLFEIRSDDLSKLYNAGFLK